MFLDKETFPFFHFVMLWKNFSKEGLLAQERLLLYEATNWLNSTRMQVSRALKIYPAQKKKSRLILFSIAVRYSVSSWGWLKRHQLHVRGCWRAKDIGYFQEIFKSSCFSEAADPIGVATNNFEFIRWAFSLLGQLNNDHAAHGLRSP